MADIQELLAEAHAEWRSMQKVSSHYAELLARHSAETEEVERLAKLLEKEEKDIEKLERRGVGSLFSKILGDNQKQLEEGRQQYLQNALNYNELVKSIDLIDFELQVLRGKLDRYEDVKRRYYDLILIREKQLLRNDDSLKGKSLLTISRAINDQKVRLKETFEAIEAGKATSALITMLEKRLREARDWGHWDMYGDMSGGGWMKHRSIDRARGYLHKVRHALLNFQKELSDVYGETHLDIDLRVERIDRYFDIFFDNLISDWVVQQRIKSALDNVGRTKAQVEEALAALADEVPLVEEKIATLERQREGIITGESPPNE